MIIETSDWPEPINTGELLSEIERLRRINVSLVAQERGFREEIERVKKAYESSQATVLKYWEQRTSDRKLLVRAAEALECHNQDRLQDALIAELRKAAE